MHSIDEVSDRFSTNGYAVAREVLSTDVCGLATDCMRLSVDLRNMKAIDAIENSGILSFDEYAPLLGEVLLKRLLPQVEDVARCEVWPTYSMWRVYRNGSRLKRHLDRPSCEVSLSIHLGGDRTWPLWIRDGCGRIVALELAPGDGVFYQGCDIPHWRETFDGQEYFQIFLHYVKKNGKRAAHKFDGRLSLGVSSAHRVLGALRKPSSVADTAAASSAHESLENPR